MRTSLHLTLLLTPALLIGVPMLAPDLCTSEAQRASAAVKNRGQAKRATARGRPAQRRAVQDRAQDNLPLCPSVSHKATTEACRCDSGLHESVFVRRFESRRPNMRRTCDAATKGARFVCDQKGQVSGFQSKVIERHTEPGKAGRTKGHCKVRYQCRFAQQKQTLVMRKGGKSPVIQTLRRGFAQGQVTLPLQTQARILDLAQKDAERNARAQLQESGYVVRSIDTYQRNQQKAQIRLDKKKGMYMRTTKVSIEFTADVHPRVRRETRFHWCGQPLK